MPVLQGDLAVFQPIPVMQMLNLAAATGELRLQREGNSASVFFEKGNLTFAGIANRPVKLGEYLVRKGLVGQAALDEALIRKPSSRKRIGEILVARSKMRVSDVLKILRSQGKRILICHACDTHFNVREFREGQTYACSRCGAPLFEPKFLDSVAVDAMLDGQ